MLQQAVPVLQKPRTKQFKKVIPLTSPKHQSQTAPTASLKCTTHQPLEFQRQSFCRVMIMHQALPAWTIPYTHIGWTTVSLSVEMIGCPFDSNIRSTVHDKGSVDLPYPHARQCWMYAMAMCKCSRIGVDPQLRVMQYDYMCENVSQSTCPKSQPCPATD